jgi:hypothetical protein
MLSFVRSDELYSTAPVPPTTSCARALVCEQSDGTFMEEPTL